MSVILDALKRLERDKAAERKEPAGFVPGLDSSHHRRTRPESWKILVTLTCVVAVTAAATIALMTVLSSAGKKTAPVAPEYIENVQHAPELPPVNEQTRAQSIAASTGGRQTPGGTPDSLKAGSGSLPRDAAPSSSQFHESRMRAEKNGDAVSNNGSSSNSLTVSGIAWQDDRVDRRAVVNGILAGEGTVVEGGARIVRIFPDRVRFSRAGQTFDVSIAGTSNGK